MCGEDLVRITIWKGKHGDYIDIKEPTFPYLSWTLVALLEVQHDMIVPVRQDKHPDLVSSGILETVKRML